MLEMITIIILIIVTWIIFAKYCQLKQSYFELLSKDKDFKADVNQILEKYPNKTQCTKEINSKYHIGIRNAKKIMEQQQN